MNTKTLLGTLIMVLALTVSTIAQTRTRVTVVTHSGEKLEGMLRNLTGNEVVVDVGGQSLKLALETIKYISFVGELERVPSLKQPAASRPIDQALNAFKELRTATEIGLLREQYSQKLLDTLPHIKKFVDGEGDDWADVRLAMKTAMRLYQGVLSSTNFVGIDSTANAATNWANAADDWDKAARWVDYVAALMSDPTEETHREKSAQNSIKLGDSITGRFGVGDATMPRDLDGGDAGNFNDVFKLDLSLETNVEIKLMGNGVCWTSLILADGRGKKLDDDKRGPYPATIRRKLSPGTYFIWAGTDRPDDVCLYSLEVGTKR